MIVQEAVGLGRGSWLHMHKLGGKEIWDWENILRAWLEIAKWGRKTKDTGAHVNWGLGFINGWRIGNSQQTMFTGHWPCARSALSTLNALTLNLAVTLSGGSQACQTKGWRALNIRRMSRGLFLRLGISNCSAMPSCSLEVPWRCSGAQGRGSKGQRPHSWSQN